MPELVLVGANPGLLLRDAGQPTAFASIWQVDWSAAGNGNALILCQDGRTLAHGQNERLCRWLVERFTQHFPESAGTGGAMKYVEAAVSLDIDLDTGMRASAGAVVVELSRPLDRRTFRAERLDLGGTAYELSNVLVPCAEGFISVSGVPLLGTPTLTSEDDRPGSSGFLAVAEVWSQLD